MVGHVAALVLAHDRALALYGSHRDATRSQVVMLVVMVGFTCLGLWLLSVANAMTVPPFAHAGHWLAQLAYLAPLIVLVGMLLLGRMRERRERRDPPE